MSYAPRILIVEDEPYVRKLFERWLSEDGYFVTGVSTGRQALFHVRHSECELVITDMSLPDLDGPDVIRGIVAEFPHIQVLAISGSMEARMASLAREAGALNVFEKPIDSRVLLTGVYSALDPSFSWKSRPAGNDI